MKWGRMLGILLLVILLLCGCNRSTAEPYTVVDDWGKTWEIDPQKRTITDGEATYKFKIRGGLDDYIISIEYPNNNCYTEQKIGDEVYGNYKFTGSSNWWSYIGNFFGVDVYTKTPSLSDSNGALLAELIHPLIPEKGGPRHWIASVVLIALGCADIMWPKIFWIFRYGLAFRQAEPSKRFLLVQNLIGVAAIVIGILLFFV